MKNLALLFIAFFLIACSNENKDVQTEAENKVEDSARQDGVESMVNNIADTLKEGPKYKITVTQKGKSLGEITITTFPQIAPIHARNFDSLVGIGFYDGLAFHRVIPEFMIQGGDPNSRNKPKETWGMGDPQQNDIPAEFNRIKHLRGILSAAREQEPNTANSQFFIMHADQTRLDGLYTAYGKVLSGMEVVDKIANAQRDERDNPKDKIVMKIVKISDK